MADAIPFPAAKRHEAAERAMREMLTGEGLPQPDEVEYREASVVLLWHETKLAVVIDLEEGDGSPLP
jgi:hypothetical protein